MLLDLICIQNFHYLMVAWVKMSVNIFGVDIGSSAHIDNKGKDVSILGIGPTQELDDTTLAAKAQYSINFSRSKRKFCLNLDHNGFYLLMLKKYISLKQKILK